MVHNGIEYGIMAAYAEGLNIFSMPMPAEEPLRSMPRPPRCDNPSCINMSLCLPDVAEVWRRGSVIASWLLDLTATELLKDPSLKNYAGRVSDSGEGRWTIKAAIDEAVPAPVLSVALYERSVHAAMRILPIRVLSAMRHEFGGHLRKSRGQ